MSAILDRLREAAAPYLDGTWRYPTPREPRRVAYPWPKGVRGPAVASVSADRATDCSTLSASLLMRLYPDAPWSQEDYADCQVMDATRLASPIEAVERVGVGVGADGWEPERLHLAQGWRSLRPLSGHAFLVWSRGNGRLDVLESTSRELRGPRWRETTPEALRALYPTLHLATLSP